MYQCTTTVSLGWTPALRDMYSLFVSFPLFRLDAFSICFLYRAGTRILYRMYMFNRIFRTAFPLLEVLPPYRLIYPSCILYRISVTLLPVTCLSITIGTALHTNGGL